MSLSERFAYIHCRPDGTPFYVGKGSLRRAKYFGERNSYHKAVVNKHGSKNILVGMLPCSDSPIAYELERGLIKRLRAMGIPLTNFTLGGEGGSEPCLETRLRLSAAAKKRGVSEACREACRKAKLGVPVPPKQIERQRIAMTGRTFSEEHKRNISVGAKKRGVSREVLEKAWAANRGRVRPKEEREKRRLALIATLAVKWAKKEPVT